MTERITAVMEKGMFRPLQPVDVPEGRHVELEVVRLLPTVEDRELAVRQMDQAFQEFWEEAAQYPEEWWDEFQRDLQANRMNFEERVSFESEG